MGDSLPDLLTLLKAGDDVVLTNEDLSRALYVAKPVSGIVGQQAVAGMKVAMQGPVDLKHGLNGFFDLFLVRLKVPFRVEVGQEAG